MSKKRARKEQEKSKKRASSWTGDPYPLHSGSVSFVNELVAGIVRRKEAN